MSRTPRPTGITEIGGAPVYGPPNRMDIDSDYQAPSGSTLDEDANSETTLVGDLRDKSPMYDDSDFIMIDGDEKEKQGQTVEDKENMPPHKSRGTAPLSPSVDVQPLQDLSASRENAQVDIQDHQRVPEKVTRSDNDTSNMSTPRTPLTPPPEAPDHPDRPPPVPPRPKTLDYDTKGPKNELEFGAQQDVTEVIANVLFQLECAIRPLGRDESGEQIDEIKK